MNRLKITTTLLISFILVLSVTARQHLPGKTWYQYTHAEDAGFSSDKLATVKQQFDSSNSAGLLVIAGGNVLLSLGNNTRKYMVHSIRKSFMNALIGRAVQNGTLNLEHTMAQFDIDDIGILTEQEKEATLFDLVASRSGIYHPAAYSTRDMIKNLPERGSHKPGEFWYYNNWDFNTLLTIYEQQANKPFFEAFRDEIAGPIGMEDFEMEDTFYKIEHDKSRHAAYLFRMSARDMARFGLLYLRQGKWNGNQLVPADWVASSTSIVSDDLGHFNVRGGYGLLWWVSSDSDGRKMYTASGSGGHRIMVMPDEDMVIVHRVNTYDAMAVSESHIQQMVATIRDAKVRGAETSPGLVPYTPKKKDLNAVYQGSMDKFLGDYKHRFLGEMKIEKESDTYFLEAGIGKFRLHATAENQFTPEDLETPIIMERARDTAKRNTVATRFGADKSIVAVVFYY